MLQWALHSSRDLNNENKREDTKKYECQHIAILLKKRQ